MKKILIISPYFAPENCIASIRFTKVAKYLKQMGYHVSVICSNHMMVDTEDEILKDDIQELDCIYRVPPMFMQRIAQKMKSRLEPKPQSAADGVGVKKKVVHKESKETMMDKLLKSQFYQRLMQRWIYISEISLGRSYIRYYKNNKSEMGCYDCVISTYGPLSSHILGRFMKENQCCEKWIADFRDVVYNAINKTNGTIKKRERLIASLCICADSISAITNQMLYVLEEYAQKFYKKSILNKAFCISNGFDQADEKYLDIHYENGKLEFAYCGTIYKNEENGAYNSDPKPMFEAVRNLIDEKKIDKKCIVFHYAGKSFDAFFEIATEFHLSECVVNHGFVKRIESLSLQKNADVILSLSWNTKNDQGIMTGKIYEAFIVRRPVLCLVSGNEPDSELGKMVKNTSIGYVWEVGNGNTLEELKTWILRVYTEKMATGEIEYRPDINAIEKYSYKFLTKKFAEVIEA